MKIRFPTRAKRESIQIDPNEATREAAMSLLQTSITPRTPQQDAKAKKREEEMRKSSSMFDQSSLLQFGKPRKLPKIHCISFNCLDLEANTFLKVFWSLYSHSPRTLRLASDNAAIQFVSSSEIFNHYGNFLCIGYGKIVWRSLSRIPSPRSWPASRHFYGLTWEP